MAYEGCRVAFTSLYSQSRAEALVEEVAKAGASGWKAVSQRRFVASNVRPVFAAIPAASVQLSDGGRIVMVGSVNAERVPASGMSLYAMSKSALAGLTKDVARDLGLRGIAINLIQRDPNDTEMHSAHGPFAEG